MRFLVVPGHSRSPSGVLWPQLNMAVIVFFPLLFPNLSSEEIKVHREMILEERCLLESSVLYFTSGLKRGLSQSQHCTLASTTPSSSWQLDTSLTLLLSYAKWVSGCLGLSLSLNLLIFVYFTLQWNTWQWLPTLQLQLMQVVCFYGLGSCMKMQMNVSQNFFDNGNWLHLKSQAAKPQSFTPSCQNKNKTFATLSCRSTGLNPDA